MILSWMAGRRARLQEAQWRNAANGSNSYIIIISIIKVNGNGGNRNSIDITNYHAEELL